MHRLLVLSCCVLFLQGSQPAAAGSARDFGGYPGYAGPQYRGYTSRALYVPAADGTRLAIDVHLPKGLAPDAKVPTVMKITRYWRATSLRWPFSLFDADTYTAFFTSHGYAVVKMDVRGTGASFGTWLLPYMPEQVTDAGRDVVQWIVEQPWSNGRVGAQGISYGGNTAAFLAVPNHPAVRAVVPRFIEFDQYTNQPFPGGICNAEFIRLWNTANWALDTNDRRKLVELDGGGWLGRLALKGVKPVDADRDGALLRAAIAEHAGNSDLTALASEMTYRDDMPAALAARHLSLERVSLHGYRAEVERSGAAYFLWGSWTDAGTANAVLSHFFTYSNPQRAVIGAWSHGARRDTDQFKPADAPLWPTWEDQMLDCLRFLDEYLRDADTGIMSEKVLHYYTINEGWKTTAVWPPAGVSPQRWFLGADRTVAPQAPVDSDGSDTYAVDFTTTSGTTNRWYTQLGGADVVYDARAEQTAKMLSYRSAPLPEALDITGHAVVSLQVRSTHDDGAFFVYLDAEAPDGRMIYLTDGQLRALHRKVSDAQPPYRLWEPYHTFERADGALMIPGEVTELTFGLQPTSVLVPAGYRLRVSIAGHDADNFTRIPAEGDPVITVERNAMHLSYIDLPVATR